MAKKPSLSEAMQRSAGHPVQESEQTAHHEHQGLKTPLPAPPSRQGKKTIAGHFDPAVSRQLRELALIEDCSVQELLRQALNLLFADRGKPPIA